MGHIPHPQRMRMLDIVKMVRGWENRDQLSQALGSRQVSYKEERAVKSWVERSETRGWTKDDDMPFDTRVAALRADSEPVFGGELPALYYIEKLLPKLPRDSVTDFRLGSLSLQAPDTFYVDFGHHKDLLIDPERGISFEGAYICSTLFGQSGMFKITLVCDDPEFEDVYETRPLGRTMERLSNSLSCVINNEMTVQEGFQRIVQRDPPSADDFMYQNMKSTFTAYEMAIKSVLYLSLGFPDSELGFSEGADERLVSAVSNGDVAAESELEDSGYPLVSFLGRRMPPMMDWDDLDPEVRAEAVFKI